ncbi:hypothetical protein Tco_0468649 [Tanacetum coccineum]
MELYSFSQCPTSLIYLIKTDDSALSFLKCSSYYIANDGIEVGDQLKSVPLVNSFSALNEDEDCDWKDPNSWQHSRSVLNESDSDVDEVITLDDRGGSLKTI